MLLFSDINECSVKSHNCHSDATCTNTKGSFLCNCNNGYSGSGVNCTGIVTVLFIYGNICDCNLDTGPSVISNVLLIQNMLFMF